MAQVLTQATLMQVDWSTIPAPADDGAAAHLPGMRVANVPLAATTGERIDLGARAGLVVIYFYPRTGRPDEPLPEGWDDIPGARGCTPQTCSFRDHFAELRELGVQEVFGVSTQDPEYQAEAAERLHLPFPLLSDEKLALANAMRLPTMEVEGMVLIKRMAWIVRDHIIERVFYPVFPPDRNAGDVLAALREMAA